MPVLNQKGLIQYIVLLVLAAGLVGGLYLVQHPTILRPHAQEVNVGVGNSLPTSSTCNRVASFSVSSPCENVPNGFWDSQYTCSNQVSVGSNHQICRTASEWLDVAQSGCQASYPCSSSGPTATPTPPSQNGSAFCEIKTCDPNDGSALCQANRTGTAPLTVKWSYGVNYPNGDGIAKIQWDFNGDGNWDTPYYDPATYTNGIADPYAGAYTFNNPGYYSPRLHVQTRNGLETPICSASVTVLAPNSGPTPTPPPYPTAKPIPTPAPVPNWTRCADEYQTCNYSGTANVRYGTNDSNYVYRTLNGPVECGNGTFGDPAFGFLKHCDYQLVGGGQYAPTPTPQPSSGSNGNWVYCSQEFSGPCTFQGTKQVRYGANGTFTDPRTFTSSVDCGNGTFGDPLPGVLKHCEYLSQ